MVEHLPSKGKDLGPVLSSWTKKKKRVHDDRAEARCMEDEVKQVAGKDHGNDASLCYIKSCAQ